MNELMTLEFETNEIKTIIQNKEIWFVANDVCKILGISNSRKAVSDLDEDEKGVTSSDTLGGKQEVNIVSESGFYTLILKSRKPEAKKFKRWVTHEVLPCIRKFGCYPAPTFNYDLDDYKLFIKDGKLLIDNWAIMWIFDKTYRTVEKDLYYLSIFRGKGKVGIEWVSATNRKWTYHLDREAFDLLASKYCIAEPQQNKIRKQYLEIFDKFEMLSA